MIFLSLIVILFSLFIYYFHKWQKETYSYFAKRDVKFKEPGIIKSILEFFVFRPPFPDLVEKLYAEFPDESITGFFQLYAPQFSIRDPNVIKKLFVKDFEYFEDHTQILDPSNEPLIGSSLFVLNGEKWRHMRATLSPAFTGSKMRQMFTLVTEYTDDVAKFLLQKATNEKLNFEMKEFFARYANDIIATCAFGLKSNSFAEPDNDFFVKANKMTSQNLSWSRLTKFLVVLTAPKLAKALKIRLFDPEFQKEFKAMILDTMDIRKEQNIQRPDMINLLMQVRDGCLEHQTNEESKAEGFATVEESDIGKQSTDRNWTDDELVAQCFLFFFAGLETVSAALTFASYEIMANPDIQQRLFEEISETNDRLNGKHISYDDLQKMKYLDQVVCEVLRKWPPAVQSERVCVKDYQYEDDTRKFIIKKGTTVIIPTYGLHHDERLFPDPESFNPDRFSDENKSNIEPSAYLPFGVGPRNCIGSRFALMEVKAILYYLLLNFSFERNEKTVVPLVLQAMPAFGIKNGLHLELKPRNK